MKVSLSIDGKQIIAEQGEKLLWVALDNGIYIPNLCSMHNIPEPSAACRLCFVEIDGYRQPVTACTELVKEGMVVNTTGKRALRLVRTGFELLMASHMVDCGHCTINRACELQKIAIHLRVRLQPKILRKIERELKVDNSNPFLNYDPNKCVLCGRCIQVCRESGILGFAHRGFRMVVTSFGNDYESKCPECGKCAEVCPAGALSFKTGSVEKGK